MVADLKMLSNHPVVLEPAFRASQKTVERVKGVASWALKRLPVLTLAILLCPLSHWYSFV